MFQCTQSIIIELRWDKIYMRYSAEAYIYCSVQPSVFSYILLNVEVSFFLKQTNQTFAVYSSNVSIFFLSPDKKERNTVCCGHVFVDEFISVCGNALKGSNVIPSIDTDLFPS